MKKNRPTVAVLAGVALILATALASPAHPCEEADASCPCPVAACAAGEASAGSSGCSCSPCGEAPVKGLTGSRCSLKQHRPKSHERPALAAGTIKPLRPMRRCPSPLQFFAIDSEVLSSTVLLI
ncbi:MAG: hypothetical protein LLG01_03395 [Planctomycetaceae bacterium]|nr:hypothetical protein [Planctomycetaceae bacterium]